MHTVSGIITPQSISAKEIAFWILLVGMGTAARFYWKTQRLCQWSVLTTLKTQFTTLLKTTQQKIFNILRVTPRLCINFLTIPSILSPGSRWLSICRTLKSVSRKFTGFLLRVEEWCYPLRIWKWIKNVLSTSTNTCICTRGRSSRRKLNYRDFCWKNILTKQRG